MAKCPKCDESIVNIHYESHKPNEAYGYNGSRSFTPVAVPCGHALGAIPVTWETRLEELDRMIKILDEKADFLQSELIEILDNLKILRKKIL